MLRSNKLPDLTGNLLIRCTMLLSGVCYDVTDDRCSDLGFTRSGQPNLLGVTSASGLTQFLEATEGRNCSVNARDFGCAAAYPTCDGTESILIHPCRYVCTPCCRYLRGVTGIYVVLHVRTVCYILLSEHFICMKLRALHSLCVVHAIANARSEEK